VKKGGGATSESKKGEGEWDGGRRRKIWKLVEKLVD
jgi:hypothetical protein